MPSDLVRALVLGIVQGMTEFLPVSSSGHLILFAALLDWEPPSLLFAATVHWGTLLSLLLVYARDVLQIGAGMWHSVRQGRLANYHAREGFFILLATLPAIGVGLWLKPYWALATDTPLLAMVGLCCTALLMGGSELWAAWREHRRYVEEMTWLNALLMGVGQAVAIVPGISRSGAAMAAGRMQLLERPGVARFSLLLGMPAILGAGLLELLSLHQAGALSAQIVDANLWAGFGASTLSGFLAIKMLIRFVRKRSLLVFAFYCLAVGTVLLWVS